MNLDEIKSIVADILNISPSEVEPDSRFIEDLGADSLDVFQIITELEDRLAFRFQRMFLKRFQQWKMQ